MFHGRSSLPERRVILYYVQKTFSDPTDENVNQRLNFGVFFMHIYIYTFCFDFFSYTVDYCNSFFQLFHVFAVPGYPIFLTASVKRFKSDIISLQFVRQNICRRNTMYSKFYPRLGASMHTHIRLPKSLIVSKVLRK